MVFTGIEPWRYELLLERRQPNHPEMDSVEIVIWKTHGAHSREIICSSYNMSLISTIHRNASLETKELVSDIFFHDNISLPVPQHTLRATCKMQLGANNGWLTYLHQDPYFWALVGLCFSASLSQSQGSGSLPKKTSTNPCPYLVFRKALQGLSSSGGGVRFHFRLKHTHHI